ncbi:MAG: S8 family serine peptidase [Acidibacillus sp.]|nr:S8 family serine peptidase [Acidibacillus sp.]
MKTLKHILFQDPSSVVPNGGNGYYPQDLRDLYNIPPELQGTGQTVGILEFSNGYNLADATDFWNAHGITSPQVEFVSVGGATNTGAALECSLDLQWIGGIAPQAQIIVYEADAGMTYESFAQAVTDTLQFILDDTTRHPSVLSISYGDAEFTFSAPICEQWADLIQQLDAKGITACIASGDQGAYGTHNLNEAKIRRTDAPASCPFAVAVGGTTLQPTGEETAWTYTGVNGGATGGGLSQVFTNRGVPDLSLNADPSTGYQIYYNGTPMVIGGTSGATPVFAAIVALANEQRAKNGLAPISGLRSWIVQHQAEFIRPLTAGDNSFNGVTGYNATASYNTCSGYGSIDATKFIQALSGGEEKVSYTVCFSPTTVTLGSATQITVNAPANFVGILDESGSPLTEISVNATGDHVTFAYHPTEAGELPFALKDMGGTELATASLTVVNSGTPAPQPADDMSVSFASPIALTGQTNIATVTATSDGKPVANETIQITLIRPNGAFHNQQKTDTNGQIAIPLVSTTPGVIKVVAAWLDQNGQTLTSSASATWATKQQPSTSPGKLYTIEFSSEQAAQGFQAWLNSKGWESTVNQA